MGYGPIQLVHASGQVQAQYSEAEAASQTFNQGVPLRWTSGTLTQCDIATSAGADWGSADVVVGVSAEAGHNLTTAGTAEGGYSETTPPNQTSAKTILVGSRMKNGKCMFWRADGNNVFRCSLKTGQTFTQADVGTTYALKYDSTTTYWYIDNTDTSGNNKVAVVVAADPNDTTKVWFQFLSTQRQY